MHTQYPVTSFSVSIIYPSVDYPVPVYTSGTQTEQDNGWAFRTAKAMLHLPDWSNGAGLPGIIGCHGGNGTAWSAFRPGDGSFGDYPRALADAGFAVLACDNGFLSNGNNMALRSLDLAYAFLTNLTGRTKVGLLGSSGGGLVSLNYHHKWPNRIGGTYVINPLIDVDASRGTTGWVTPYVIKPGDPNAAIDYTTRDPATNAGAYKLGVTDPEGDWITNAVNQGHTPARYPQDFADKNIRVSAAWYDASVPYQSETWWVKAVNSPSVTLHISTNVATGHSPSSHLFGSDSATIAAGGLPRSDIRDFFLSCL